MLGFGDGVTQEELTILSCFKDKSKIGFPLGGMSVKDTNTTLVSLKKKCIITGDCPYYLTKKGKRLMADINKEQQNENKRE